MAERRSLTAEEEELVVRILDEADDEPAASLRAQVVEAKVASSSPCFLELEVDGARATGLADGPLGVRAYVNDPSRGLCGEVLVWIEDGRLAAIEYAWVTEEMPSGLPPAAWLTFSNPN